VSKTKIAWSEFTWNAIVGCSKVPRVGKGKSPCHFCYAMGDAPHRFPAVYEREGVVKLGSNPKRPGLTFVPRDGDGKSLGKGAQWTGEVRLLPWKLDEPLRRKKPTKYFVNSLADIFHDTLVRCEEGRRFIAAIFGVMAACPQHTFQILTKRDPRPWFEWLSQQPAPCRPDGLPAAIGETVLGWCWRGDAWDIVVPRECNFIAEAADHASVEHVDVSAAMQDMEPAPVWPLPNVWVGVSVEDQSAADERIPWLLDTPAAVRWLSVEPMLGPVDLSEWIGVRDCPTCDGEGVLAKDIEAHERETGCEERHDIDDDGAHCHCGVTLPPCPDCADYSQGRRRPDPIDWVVCGGESGPGARPMHPDWARSLRDQCVEAGVKFHFKQWGAWTSVASDDPTWTHMVAPDGRTFARGEDIPLDVMTNMSAVAFMKRVGKKAAGRMLDGRTWDEFPG